MRPSRPSLGPLRRALAAAGAVVAVVALVAGVAAAEPSEARAVALDLVNADRIRAARPPLVRDPALDAAAAAHAADMLARDYFAHVTPEGVNPSHRAARAGVRWRRVTENIGWCRGCRIDAARLRRFQASWMTSRSHRANLLDPRLRAFGFAIVAQGDLVYAVQTFGGGW